MTKAKAPLLVSTQWLEDNLQQPNLRLFDCTTFMGPQDNKAYTEHYKIHHIPSAAHLDLASKQSGLCDQTAPAPYTWPTKEQVEKALSQAGISADSHVVLYAAPQPEMGAANIFWATRAWWIMFQAGVACSILDGGWTKWLAENRQITDREHEYAPSDFIAENFHSDLITNRDTVLSSIENPNLFLVDALSPASYNGEIDLPYTKRRGHIPSAVNIPYDQVVESDTGCFLSPEKLKTLFELKGYTTAKQPVFYCGGGIATTLTAFAFKLAGLSVPQIYAAGLMEWANDDSLPMEVLGQ